MIVLGADPGINAAVSLMEESRNDLVVRGYICIRNHDFTALTRWLQEVVRDEQVLIGIEDQYTGINKHSAKRIAQARGKLEQQLITIVNRFGGELLEVVEVAPVQWQVMIGCRTDAPSSARKSHSLMIAAGLIGCTTYRWKQVHGYQDISDSIHIGMYAWNKHKDIAHANETK